MDSKAAMQDRFAIQERLRNQQQGFPIYNGSDRVQRLLYATERFELKPDAKFFNQKTQELEEHDGVTYINDIYRPDPQALREWRSRQSAGEGRGEKPPRATVRAHTAGDVIAHLASKHRNNGITELAIADIYKDGVLVRTMAEENDRLKKAARDTWVKTRKVDCELILKRYRARTAEMKPGDPEKFFNAEEVAAEKWLTQFESKKVDRTKFVCPHGCGFWSHDEDDLAPHIAARHTEAEPEEVIEKAAKGGRRKSA